MRGVDIEIHIKDLKCFGECYIDFQKGKCVINALYVSKKHRHSGVGKFLITTAETFIKNALKKNTAILYVEKDTWQADWYKSIGYCESSIQEGAEDYIKMEKNL